MAIIVEDGTGVVGANSYSSVAALDAYAVHRLDLSGYTTAQKEAALVIASSDWLDGEHSLRGEPVNEDQGLHFPTDKDGFPKDIKTAAMKATLLELQGLLRVDLTTISTTGAVESEAKSVGPLSKSTTYRAGTEQRYSRVLPSDLTRLLWPYIVGGRGFTVRM